MPGTDGSSRPTARPRPATPRPGPAPRPCPATGPNGFHGPGGTRPRHGEARPHRGAERGVVPVLAITGPGGADKTALAARIADLVADRFPDGRLFADLRTWSPAPADPGPVLAHLLHTLEVPAARIPADPDQRAALYRSALAVRRVLVVLEGARFAAQVTPLLPGTPGSAVLLTTRSRVLAPALPGTTHIELTAHPRAADPSCGEGADESDVGAPGADIPGHEHLSPELARAARRLTHRGAGPLSVDALAAVLGTGRAHAAGIAEALVDAGVLDTPAAGTYRLPIRP